MTRVLVTGATGFVGRVACARLIADGYVVRRALRSAAAPLVPPDSDHGCVEDYQVGDIGPATAWDAALDGVDAVLHLAARVHVMHGYDAPAEYQRVNVDGTERLAEAAAASGVRRLVFVSSVKVHGEESTRAYRETDAPQPLDAYGQSKWQAEQALGRIVAAAPQLESVVLRPPLVYGPGVGANFLRLMQLVARGVPLPLGAVRNRRSLVFVGNLADALVACIEHPDAAGRTFLVADDDALSTPELIGALAQALGVRPRLLTLPPAWISAAGALTRQSPAVQRLCGSLEVDSGAIRHALGWTPPFATQRGLNATAHWFRGRQHTGAST